jgi:hypothetical protein
VAEPERINCSESDDQVVPFEHFAWIALFSTPAEDRLSWSDRAR